MDNFDRNVWCLLGLPFDVIDMDETVKKVHNAAKSKTPLFISTPNLNFLISSMNDEKFRDSVINSDLSIADGKPLIWIARLLRIPIPEQVAGSDLIDALIENKEGYKPLKVFFFGGQEGIAEQACEKLNVQNKGLCCVGFHNPGFGTIEEMSSTEIIDKINKSSADFVIVSLGAKKGQEWIECNREKLNAPIISHLGAVVNFITGNVIRSPKFLRKIGLEWLWRIKEEPSLWRRYFSDGLSLLKLMVKKVIPYGYLIYRSKNKLKRFGDVIIQRKVKGDSEIISISGVVVYSNLDGIKNLFKNINDLPENIIINLDELLYLDSAFIGYLLLLRKNLQVARKKLCIKTISPFIQRIFILNGCEFMLI